MTPPQFRIIDGNDAIRAGKSLRDDDGDEIDLGVGATPDMATVTASNDNALARGIEDATQASALDACRPQLSAAIDTGDSAASYAGASHIGIEARAEAEALARLAKPRIYLWADRSRTVDEAVDVVGRASNRTYQRGGNLVRITQECNRPRKLVAVARSPAKIEPWEPSTLSVELTRVAQCFEVKGKVDQQGNTRWETNEKDPPQWLIATLLKHKEWTCIRQLIAIVETPVIDADGNVQSGIGYDRDTGLLFAPPDDDSAIASAPEQPTAQDVAAARVLLENVVADFPFVDDAHRAGWVTLVATMVARFAFAGPTPLFVIDASTPGTGKTLLATIASLIATGVEPWKAQWSPDDPGEQRKLLTSLAMSGPRSILFDNLERGVALGGSVLCDALTTTQWSDRVLGGNATFTGPWTSVVAATGNNVMLGADMHRRVVHIRLESDRERPEERASTSFMHRDLKAYVRDHQAELLSAVLTIQRGFACAGRPPVKLTEWGSYEGWSRAVRAPLVWAGFADCGVARDDMRAGASLQDEASSRLVAGLENLAKTFPNGEFGTQDAYQRLFGEHDRYGAVSTDDGFGDLRLAIAEVRNPNEHAKMSAAALGHVLSDLRGRVLDDRVLRSRKLSGRRQVWRVEASSSGGST